MKNVLFSSGSLRMGGLERILVEVLQNIDKSIYNVSLVITDDAGDKNIFLKDIPSEIKPYFLVSEDVFNRGEELKYSKKGIVKKMQYNTFLSKSRKLAENNFLKYIQGHLVDTIVDFDGGLSRFIEKVNVTKKSSGFIIHLQNCCKKRPKLNVSEKDWKSMI